MGELSWYSGKPVGLKVYLPGTDLLLLVAAQTRAEHASGDEAAREEGEDRDEVDDEDEEDDEEGECCRHMRAPFCPFSSLPLACTTVLSGSMISCAPCMASTCCWM